MSSDCAAPSPTPSFFLNIPSNDPAAAETFFRALGLELASAWSDESTKSFTLPPPNGNICVMIHAHERFKEFIRPGTDISDAKKSTEALFAISVKTREEVDQWLAKAAEAGAALDPYKIADYGKEMGMYTRSFADLDGHIWEVLTDLPKPEGETEKKE